MPPDPPDYCPQCGVRCEICDERMCGTWGPEPAVTCSAHPACVSCEADNTCRDCATIRRATARAAAAWEHAAEPQPWIDPVRDAAADTWAELHATERAYGLARLEDREEGISA